jgi:hypothetical protein
MALDRTWYNSLVDDDGSGLTGSVWDKADVDALMDAVDDQLLWIDGQWANYTPGLYASAGTLSSATAYGRYRYFGTHTVMVQYSIENATLSTAALELMIALPIVAASGWLGLPSNPCSLFIATNEVGFASIGSNKTILSVYRAGTNFPAGSGLYIRGTMTYVV